MRDCWASFFSERAIFYRQKKGSLDDLGMAVVVQRMVRADVAGVLFTCDPVQRRRDRMVVEAVLGLGEAAVSGQVTPDHYVLKRDGTIKQARSPSSRSRSSRSRTAAPRSASSARRAANRSSRRTSCAQLARIGDDLEQRLGGPQDIEWALEGGEIFVLQARPVTT